MFRNVHISLKKTFRFTSETSPKRSASAKFPKERADFLTSEMSKFLPREANSKRKCAFPIIFYVRNQSGNAKFPSNLNVKGPRKRSVSYTFLT